MKPRLLGLVSLVVLATPVGGYAECITVNAAGVIVADAPPPPAQTIELSGALCGTLYKGGLRGVPVTLMVNAEVWLYSSDDIVVAKAEVTGTGEFAFPPLPRGEYRFGIPGFEKTVERISVGEAAQDSCHRSLYVLLQLVEECRTPSRISDKPFLAK